VRVAPPATRNLPRKAAPPDQQVRRRGAEVRIHGWPVRFLGGFLFSLLTGRQTNFDWNVGSFIVAVIGALVLLFISTPDAADLIPHEPVRARPDTERRGKGP
jgi:hypothetical protein